MGTLRTLAWTIVNNERTCREVVVDLKNVTNVVAHTEPSGGKTCLLVLRSDQPSEGSETVHVDLPIDQMEIIVHRHSVDPTRMFKTHGITSPSRKKSQKTSMAQMVLRAKKRLQDGK